MLIESKERESELTNPYIFTTGITTRESKKESEVHQDTFSGQCVDEATEHELEQVIAS